MLRFISKYLGGLGRYFVVLAEYTFAGIVIGSIVSEKLPFSRALLIGTGIAFSFFLAFTGLVMQEIADNRQN